MMVRVVAIAGALNPSLIGGVGLPAAAGAGVLAIGSAMLLLRHGEPKVEHSALALRNPFELMTVLKLAGLIAVVMVLAKALSDDGQVSRASRWWPAWAGTWCAPSAVPTDARSRRLRNRSCNGVSPRRLR